MTCKKSKQLGMNPSTARSRLVGDLLWKLLEPSEHNKCFRCGQPMCRDTYSIEHKESWLDSSDPVGLYFDLENVSFSHQSCNSAAARRPHKHASPEAAEAARLANLAKAREWKQNNRSYDPVARKERYERVGS